MYILSNGHMVSGDNEKTLKILKQFELSCIGDEKPDIIFSCVEVIIQMLRLEICTRVVPNDGRVDRGGSL